MLKKHIDPEYERWHRKYPRFPGVAKCIELLCRGDVSGAWVDIICDELTAHAHESLQEIIDEAGAATEHSPLNYMLLHVIADARLPEALSFLIEHARSADEQARTIAINGLKQLDSKESRRALWDAGVR